MALPPGPKTHPLISTYHWLKHPDRFLLNLNQQYGNMFTVTMFLGKKIDTVFLGDVEAINAVFTSLSNKFVTGEINAQFSLTSTLGPNSLLLLDGQKHKRQRRLISPSFQSNQVRMFSSLISDCAQSMIDKWQKGQVVSLLKEMEAITLKVMVESLFGQSLKERIPKIVEITKGALSVPPMYLFLPFLRVNLGKWTSWGKFLYWQSQLNDIILNEIEERRKNPPQSPRDVLDMLMQASNEEDKALSESEIRDQCVELIFAGYATTAVSLAWCFVSFLNAPQIVDKIIKEYDEVVGDKPLTSEIISKLVYLDAAIKESMRMHDIFPMLTRKVVEPVEIKGYSLPLGTLLSPCPILVHKSPSLYPEPDTFRPERFLEDEKASNLLSFGGGPRRCIGRSFALFEMKLLLANILPRVRMELVPGQSFQPKWDVPTLVPSTGVKVKLLDIKPRN